MRQIIINIAPERSDLSLLQQNAVIGAKNCEAVCRFSANVASKAVSGVGQLIGMAWRGTRDVCNAIGPTGFAVIAATSLTGYVVYKVTSELGSGNIDPSLVVGVIGGATLVGGACLAGFDNTILALRGCVKAVQAVAPIVSLVPRKTGEIVSKALGFGSRLADRHPTLVGALALGTVAYLLIAKSIDQGIPNTLAVHAATT